MGFGLVIGFTGLLKLITIINYTTITDSHTLHYTTAHTNSPVVLWEWLSMLQLPQLPDSHPYWLVTVSQLKDATPGH
jgi:hypothetical protein